MFDQLMGLVLLGLGLKNPMTGQVAGEETLRPREMVVEKRHEASQEGQTKRLEVRDNATQKRQELQTKLKEFRDGHKKETVERLNTRLGEVNKNRTNKMSEHVGKLEEILAKLTTRSTDLKSKGKDTTNADSLLSSAKSAIEAAKSSVSAQSGKSYTITINEESTAKNDVGAAMKGLQSDLQSVRALVNAARKALKDAALALRALSDEPIEAQ